MIYKKKKWTGQGKVAVLPFFEKGAQRWQSRGRHPQPTMAPLPLPKLWRTTRLCYFLVLRFHPCNHNQNYLLKMYLLFPLLAILYKQYLISCYLIINFSESKFSYGNFYVVFYLFPFKLILLILCFIFFLYRFTNTLVLRLDTIFVLSYIVVVIQVFYY